jgi:NADPH:quinone reductase-like Zn-dependent oxidoreductase
MVRSIGADRVIDYTQEDFTKSSQHYDIIFDLVANHSVLACRRVLNPKGMYIGAGILAVKSLTGILARLVARLVLSPFVSHKFVTFMARSRKEDLTVLRELMASGKVRPIIDSCYTLSEVPEAMRYLAEGHARGKVVITLENNKKQRAL